MREGSLPSTNAKVSDDEKELSPGEVIWGVIVIVIIIMGLVRWMLDPLIFDPSKSRCHTATNVLYTNVGTPIFGRDGKPVACLPKN